MQVTEADEITEYICMMSYIFSFKGYPHCKWSYETISKYITEKDEEGKSI
jgi:hypothetical protein